MNGVHDLGGMHGFGPVRPETGDEIFHAEWERRALALVVAVGGLGLWNIDQSRFARESLPAADYLGSSYYRIWIMALERSLARAGVLSEDGPQARAVPWERLRVGLDAGTPYARQVETEAAYAVGQQVRTRTMHPEGHTRLPRYARGRTGTVVAVRGAHVFPDRNAVPIGEQSTESPEWLYTVEFDGAELWGPDSEPGLRVSIDAWEPYLAALDA